VTDRLPKCLVEIQGHPLLRYWLAALFEDPRVERVLINTHYLADQVRAFIGASPWADRVDLVHEDRLLGTGGTIWANRAYFEGGPMFVAHADNLTDARLSRLIDMHAGAGADILATMLAFRTETPQSCGILELDDSSHVFGFHEKVPDPPGNLANGAVYIFAPKVLDRIAAIGHRVVDLSTEIIPGLLPYVLAVEHPGFFMDIGTPEALEQARRAFPRRA
jgi:mannose-1-phosphate guanylyltransferase